MIILDTNVVSEPMRPRGHPRVQAWLDEQIAETLYLTAISLSELLLDVELLPQGKRKGGLNAALRELLSTLFGSRILPFDQAAASLYAERVGRAAIAAVHGFTVATRDTAPFVAAGVPVINPWEA